MSDVKANIAYLEAATKKINLFLNHDKSEIICVDELPRSSMLSSSPSFCLVDLDKATLLGAPIGGDISLNIISESKMEQLQALGNHLKQLQAHDALCLLQNALAIPKVLYIFHTAPNFKSTVLSSSDGVLRTLWRPYTTSISVIRAELKPHCPFIWEV